MISRMNVQKTNQLAPSLNIPTNAQHVASPYFHRVINITCDVDLFVAYKADELEFEIVHLSAERLCPSSQTDLASIRKWHCH